MSLPLKLNDFLGSFRNFAEVVTIPSVDDHPLLAGHVLSIPISDSMHSSSSAQLAY